MIKGIILSVDKIIQFNSDLNEADDADASVTYEREMESYADVQSVLGNMDTTDTESE